MGLRRKIDEASWYSWGFYTLLSIRETQSGLEMMMVPETSWQDAASRKKLRHLAGHSGALSAVQTRIEHVTLGCLSTGHPPQ